MANVSVLGLHDGAESGCNYYRQIVPFQQLREYGYDYDWMPMLKAPTADAETKTRELAAKEAWSDERLGWELDRITDLRGRIERGEYVGGSAGKTSEPGASVIPAGIAGKRHQITTIVRPVFVENDAATGEPRYNGDFIRNMVERLHSVRSLVGGDFDDDFWSIEDHNPAKKELGKETVDFIRVTVRELDFITCTNERLAQRIIAECGIAPERVYLLPNLVDFELYDNPQWELTDAQGKQAGVMNMRELRRQRITADARQMGDYANPDRPVVIGLQGGASHFEDWKVLEGALPRLCEKWGDKIRIVVAGYHPDYLKEALAKYADAGIVRWQGWRFFNQHSETVMSFDINLCPLKDTVFNWSKSPIKWVEASAAGAASVVSPVVYGDYVEPGVTALVAQPDNADEWFRAIDHLVANPGRRRQIARNAHITARVQYDLRANVAQWLTAYEHIWATLGKQVQAKWMVAQELKEDTAQKQALATVR